jgi:hypothetical protein
MINRNDTDAPRQALIPGAYERNTLTHREPGSIGGPAYGSTDVPIGPSSMAPETVAERKKEGGGGASQRRGRVDVQSQGGEKHRRVERGPGAHSVQSGTALPRRFRYSSHMQTDHVKAAVIMGWILAGAVLGYLTRTTSLSGWMLLAAATVLPPVVMMSLWRAPAPSMSESIREVVRRT